MQETRAFFGTGSTPLSLDGQPALLLTVLRVHVTGQASAIGRTADVARVEGCVLCYS